MSTKDSLLLEVDKKGSLSVAPIALGDQIIPDPTLYYLDNGASLGLGQSLIISDEGKAIQIDNLSLNQIERFVEITPDGVIERWFWNIEGTDADGSLLNQSFLLSLDPILINDFSQISIFDSLNQALNAQGAQIIDNDFNSAQQFGLSSALFGSDPVPTCSMQIIIQ